MGTRISRSRIVRRGAAFGALAALGFVMVSSCNETAAPPPPPVSVDFVGHYDAATRTLRLDPPSASEPLQFLVEGITADSARGMLYASVRLRNVGGEAVMGPEGVAFFEFGPQTVQPGAYVVCDPPDAAAPQLPAGACLRNHRGGYGNDGMLAPGELSGAVMWDFRGWTGTSFSFHARPVYSGLAASGEISGFVYDDRNANGRRDRNERGLSGYGVALQYADSVGHGRTDGSGRFVFHVSTPGTYPLSRPLLCCVEGSGTCAAPIRRRTDGTLSAFGGADFGCAAGAPHLPRAVLVDVGARRGDLAPCAAAAPCTIPFGTPFEIRFTGAGRCDRITGFQWQGIRPGDTNPEPFQPYGADTLFLPTGRDTLARAISGDTLWALRGDTVAVRYRNQGADTLGAGTFVFRARVRDEMDMVSLLSAGTWQIPIDFDPETQIQRRAACQCPVPPPSCGSLRPPPVGWITGIDATSLPLDGWIPFCAGDTLPIHSRVRFYSTGRDDPRDLPIDPLHGPREVGFAYRFQWRAGPVVNLNMPFSPEYRAEDLPLPGGGTLRGGSSGWEPCPFDFAFFTAAVDEHGKRDGTPDSIPFFVSGAPAVDSLAAPSVLILVPQCGATFAGMCTDPGSLPRFGPDTLVVVGRWVADTDPPQTPLGVGYNRFDLPLLAFGHDHPRDRNAPGRAFYTPEHEGRIREWKYRLDCTGSGCSDLAFPGEGQWRPDLARVTDPPGRQVFDDTLRITLPLDTLCTTSPCQIPTMRAVIAGSVSGPYSFSIQGRDYDATPCSEPSDLGPNPYTLQRPPWGRETSLVGQQLTLVQVHELHRGSEKPARRSWFAFPRHALR